MTWLFHGRVGRQLRCAGFDVAEPPIKSRKFFAQVDHTQIHVVKSGGTGMLLGGRNQPRSQTAPLSRWIDRKQSKITAVASWFHVDAAGESLMILRKEEPPRGHQPMNSFGGDAIALDEESLHQKGRIDEARQSLDVSRQGDTKASRIGSGRTHRFYFNCPSF